MSTNTNSAWLASLWSATYGCADEGNFRQRRVQHPLVLELPEQAATGA